MGRFGQFGSTPEEAMGLARARGLESEEAARQHRGHYPIPRRSGRSIKRVFLIGAGLFVLLGWTLTIITALRAS